MAEQANAVRREVCIAGRCIGEGHAPYVVAEMSGNHNGDLSHALEIMAAAKEAGADAVKLQTYTADTLTINCDRQDFQISDGLWGGRSLYELYQEASTPWDWHEALFAKGQELGITVFSSPFDVTAVDFLQELQAPAFKIASFELVDLPLIRKTAQMGKPLVMSTGMANLGEIAEAVTTARDGGCNEIILLHCISAYPTPPEESNLRTLTHLADAFDTVSGLSDHTMSNATSIAAVALGACFIEKHFTLRRADGGPDAAFSLEPDEFRALATGVREAWAALGSINYGRSASEQANVTFRRSIYAVEDIAEGEQLTSKNVRIIRPGYGLAPKFLPQVLGRHARQAIDRGTAMQWSLLA